MLNKRIKAGFKKIHNKNPQIRFCLGTIALISVCVLLLIVSTFTQLHADIQIPGNDTVSVIKFEYIPQIPVVIFIAGLLGEFWGLLSIIIYIILALTPHLPIFGLGGGFSYIFEYNFGYILGYIFGLLRATKELKKGGSIIYMLLAVFWGVFLIHITGIVYTSILAIIKHESFDFVQNYIYYQSLCKISYDVIFGIIAIFAAKVCKKILWLIMG